jgi:hypothetical protein
MLFKITLLTSHILAVIYPLCFWISATDPLKNKFHKFHLGFPNTLGGVVLVVILVSDVPIEIKICAIVWKATFLAVSRFYWKKEYPNPKVILIPCVFGLINFVQLQSFYVAPDWRIATIGILAGIVLASSLYAMNLGHWYLNVHGLPLKHLRWSMHVFFASLAIRFIWGLVSYLATKTLYQGEDISLFAFSKTLDGFFLVIGIFFGTIFPLIAAYFAYGTLKVKNTQSTTGILYVILSAVCLGDLIYKYYLMKYLIPL